MYFESVKYWISNTSKESGTERERENWYELIRSLTSSFTAFAHGCWKRGSSLCLELQILHMSWCFINWWDIIPGIRFECRIEGMYGWLGWAQVVGSVINLSIFNCLEFSVFISTFYIHKTLLDGSIGKLNLYLDKLELTFWFFLYSCKCGALLYSGASLVKLVKNLPAKKDPACNVGDTTIVP